MERFIKSIILILVVVFIGYFILNSSNNSLNSNNDEVVESKTEFVTIEDFNALKEEINSSNNETSSSLEIKEFTISGIPIIILEQFAGFEITDQDFISSILDYGYGKNLLQVNFDGGFDISYGAVFLDEYYFIMGMQFIGSFSDINMLGILIYNNSYYFVNDDFIDSTNSSEESGVVATTNLVFVNFRFIYFN